MVVILVLILVALAAPNVAEKGDTSILDSIEEIRGVLMKHEAEIRQLKSENVMLRNDVSELMTEQTNLKERELNLIEELEGLKREIRAISTQDKADTAMRKPSSKRHCKMLRPLENTAPEYYDRAIRPETSENKRQNKRLLLINPVADPISHVAFTAKLGSHAVGLGIHQTITFERIQTNLGNAYSTDTGVFTAPVNGTYYFFATIMSHSGEYLETEIVRNGQHIVYMYSQDTHFEQGTNSAVLTLDKGDHVWVRTNDGSSHNVYGGDWSTFSGFLLF